MAINYRHNVMDVGSVATFARVRGGYNQGNRDVYFLRAIGGNHALIQDIQEMDAVLDAAMEQRQLHYKRISSLPMNMEEKDRAYYFSSYENWIASNCTSMKIYAQSDNEAFCTALGAALKIAGDAFDQIKAENTESIKRNFIIKLMLWTDFVLKDGTILWNERSCIKVIAENVVKVQEYLFYYMLTLIGADILLVQTKQDIEIADWLKNYSKKLVLGDYVTWNLPEYVHTAHTQNTGKKDAAANMAQNTAVSADNNQGAVRVSIPARAGRATTVNTVQPAKPVQAARPAKVQPESTTPAAASANREKSFEELALLASSIVMITIHDQNGEPIGSGSGIMIGENGYILTNNHVVRGGCFYSVQIEDDSTVYKTDEVIKYHSVLDLAIIRIPRKLKPLPIYHGSAGLVRGQKVVAIGSPLGLFNSVSDGIISGFRTIDSVDMIQFTAPTSPGSSGGAVLNMAGEVIGISTAGIDRGQNLNLAVLYGDINLFIKGFC